MAISFGILAVVLVLAYFFLIGPALKHANFVRSKANLKAMARGLGLYAEANNDGFPPVYFPGAKDANGRPITWANQIFDYVGRMEVFENAANPEGGNTMLTRTDTQGNREDVALSYGMLSSADTARRYEMRDDAILLAETIGSGVCGSFNPLPLGGTDGFTIGYDNSNVFPDAQTNYVTRLAFLGEGPSPLGLMSVHPLGINAIRADGSLVTFSSAGEAFSVSKSGGKPSGQWVPY
ncbi:MAG: hypothetical protein ABIV13_07060 [Fimbriimonadales bacterium]